MRLSRRTASVSLAVALVLTLAYEAVPQARVTADDRESADARVPADERDSADPFGAACRIRVTGSKVTAYCHNPYPETDRVSLHVECARWWDIDTDSSPVEAGPAQTVRLTGRCWKEVGDVWISHRRES
ncbi:hypothetical protein [Streptomyces cahuitamycinicus]|uniref:Secreted protein n=1 Tax=Streptomyces cahuitamycinicus TaxID=2070367 RepID=A0A2N8TV53_9ACTN|nr:hypothetical protein [Streptomyces cahuitamycinicus]PNG22881.1 hypothetical protein C1J00_06880 [Streptomyces cahuitamycinicus]